jgi:cytochrome b561
MKQVSRYHPVLVTLHWVLAVLLVAELAVGFFGLASTPNADPAKIGTLRWHMAGGMLILGLMTIRFIVRALTSNPPNATTGHRVFDRLALVSHHAFYVMVLLMAGTGFATGILAGLPEVVFADSGDRLPATFTVYPTRVAHGYLAWLLVALIFLHVAAALYHGIVRGDGLLRRMSFGRRA